jgi:hypothetical protein
MEAGRTVFTFTPREVKRLWPHIMKTNPPANRAIPRMAQTVGGSGIAGSGRRKPRAGPMRMQG